LGLFLLGAAPSEAVLRMAVGYGVFGPSGSLAEMATAMEAKLLPPAARLFSGVAVAVPALATGLALNAAPLAAAGKWALSAAVPIAASTVRVMAHAWGENLRTLGAENSAAARAGGAGFPAVP
jgi:hypothetical protein